MKQAVPAAKLAAEWVLVPEALRHGEQPHLSNLGVVPHNSVAKAHVCLKALSARGEVRRRKRRFDALSLWRPAKEGLDLQNQLPGGQVRLLGFLLDFIERYFAAHRLGLQLSQCRAARLAAGHKRACHLHVSGGIAHSSLLLQGAQEAVYCHIKLQLAKPVFVEHKGLSALTVAGSQLGEARSCENHNAN